jgi:hypothetical protein
MQRTDVVEDEHVAEEPPRGLRHECHSSPVRLPAGSPTFVGDAIILSSRSG